MSILLQDSTSHNQDEITDLEFATKGIKCTSLLQSSAEIMRTPYKLEALRIVGVENLASRTPLTNSRSGVILATALAVLGETSGSRSADDVVIRGRWGGLGAA
jgi:hypothetical protein